MPPPAYWTFPEHSSRAPPSFRAGSPERTLNGVYLKKLGTPPPGQAPHLIVSSVCSHSLTHAPPHPRDDSRRLPAVVRWGGGAIALRGSGGACRGINQR